MCCRSNARTVPRNYILLFIFTLSETYFVAAITAFSDPKLVFIALGLTAGIVFSLTIYAFYTKEDFTVCGALLFMLVCMILVASIMNIFVKNKTVEIIIAAVSVCVYGIYLVMDT